MFAGSKVRARDPVVAPRRLMFPLFADSGWIGSVRSCSSSWEGGWRGIEYVQQPRHLPND